MIFLKYNILIVMRSKICFSVENINDKKRAQEVYESHIFKGYKTDFERVIDKDK